MNNHQKILRGSCILFFLLSCVGCGGGGGSGGGAASSTTSSETANPAIPPENPVVNIPVVPPPPEEPPPDIVISDVGTGGQAAPVPPRATIYVAKGNPNASDNNEGTLDAPLSTIEAAFEKADRLSNPVTLYVSAESYVLRQSLTMDKIMAIEGGYLPDFSTQNGEKTELVFENVDDDVLIYLKSDPRGGLIVPVNSFKNLSIQTIGKTGYYHAIASPRENLPLFFGFSLVSCEVYGSIFLGRKVLDFVEIRDNQIFGSDGGRPGGASPDNRYNFVIEGVYLSPVMRIINNVISGGELVGEYPVRSQSLIYFPSSSATFSNSSRDFDIVIERNQFICGRVDYCLSINMDGDIRDIEGIAPIYIRRNIFRGSETPDNRAYVVLSTGTQRGHVEFVENEIYFPNIEGLTGVAIWSSIGNADRPYYKIESNLFTFSEGRDFITNLLGIGLSDVVGQINIQDNRFDFPDGATRVSRRIYQNGNPEEAAIINSDEEVVVER